MKGNTCDLTELHCNQTHNVGLHCQGPRVTRLSPGPCVHSGSAHGLASPDTSSSEGSGCAKAETRPRLRFWFHHRTQTGRHFKRINIKVLHGSCLYSAAFLQSVKGLNLHTNSLCELSCLCSSPEGDMWKMEYLHLNFKFLVLHGNYHYYYYTDSALDSLNASTGFLEANFTAISYAVT